MEVGVADGVIIPGGIGIKVDLAKTVMSTKHTMVTTVFSELSNFGLLK